jgi:Putative transcription activator
MNITDRLYLAAEINWIESAEKPFPLEMAEGTLDESLFKNYMIQDYLYLQDYIVILKKMLELSNDEEVAAFIKNTLDAIEYETYNVHAANMKALGVTDADVESCVRTPVILRYVEYMKKQLEEGGLLYGLTALLQCSWNYAILGAILTERYPDMIAKSKYKSWFDAYTSDEYVEANESWIALVNKQAADLPDEEVEKLCEIFTTCATFENRFWDALYEYKEN